MTEPNRAPAECIVLIGDQDEEIDDLYPYIKSVEVHMSRSAATTCSIVLDTFRDEMGDWFVEDQNIFVPWKPLVIKAQFGSDHQEVVMRGYVKEVVASHPIDMSAASVTVKGQDGSLRLDREHQRRVWSTESEQMSDGDIAASIASDNGLISQAEAGLTNASLNQDGTSIDFLRQRAEANGFELFVRDGVLNFGSPRLDDDPQPTIMVHAGTASNCLSFDIRWDGHKPDKVRVIRAADTGAESEEQILEPDLTLLGEKAASSGDMGLPEFVWTMNRPGGATRAEADARAQAAVNEKSWKLEATGELDGSLYGHVLLSHATVDVDGVGTVHGGTYYVDEVTHRFSNEGYRQRFKLLRNATGQPAMDPYTTGPRA